MNKILYLLLVVFISSCSTHPTGNPKEDAEFVIGKLLSDAAKSDSVSFYHTYDEYAETYKDGSAKSTEYFGRIVHLMGADYDNALLSDNTELKHQVEQFIKENSNNSILLGCYRKAGKTYIMNMANQKFTGNGSQDAYFAYPLLQVVYSIGFLPEFLEFYQTRYAFLPHEEGYLFCNNIQASLLYEVAPEFFQFYLKLHQDLYDNFRNGTLDASRYPDIYRTMANFSEMQSAMNQATQNYTPQ